MKDDSVLARLSFQALKRDTYLSKLLIEAGLVDMDFEWMNKWSTIVDKTHLVTILSFVSSKDFETLSRICRKMPDTSYDKSNLRKHIVTLLDLRLLYESTNEHQVKTFKQTPIGSYFMKHAGPAFMTRNVYQKALIGRDKKIMKLESVLNSLEKLINESDDNHLTSQANNILESIKSTTHD